MTDVSLSDTIARVRESSALDRLRQRRAELEHGVLLDVELPGYHGELVARYKRLTPEDFMDVAREVAGTINKPVDAQLVVAAQVLTQHVQEITMLTGDGRHEALDPDDPQPLRFDDRLAELLNFEIPPDWNPRVVLLACVGRGNEAVVIGMARRFLDWTGGLGNGVRETLQGESRATLP